MEKFKTLIKKEHEQHSGWSCYNQYIVGVIRGIQLVMCSDDFYYAHRRTEDGLMLTAECTEEQYEKFMEFVEKYYPGLCEFNYKEEA